MSVRLTVIMIESPPPTASAGRLAEEIVGNLIGRPGIDVTLVRSLSGLDKSSTDQLMIDGVTGDVAVLDWQDADSIVSSLHRAGFEGQRAAHPFDSEPSARSDDQRRIYAFNLNQFSDAIDLINALDALKSDRQIRTFSIGRLSGPVANQPTTTISSATQPPATEEPQVNPRSTDHDGSDIDLDDLIDQLDQSET